MATTESSSTDSPLDASVATAESTSLESDEASQLSRDIVFDVLSCRRRRDVIHCLRQANGSLSLRELSEQIAAWENEVPVKGVTYKERMRVYTALKQSHLPKLDEAGVIEYDDDRGVSRITDATTDVEYYLDVVPANDIPWSQYYLGLGVLSSTFVIVAWLGLTPLSTLGGFGWSVLISGCFIVSALVHRYRERSVQLNDDRPSLD